MVVNQWFTDINSFGYIGGNLVISSCLLVVDKAELTCAVNEHRTLFNSSVFFLLFAVMSLVLVVIYSHLYYITVVC